MFRINFLFVLIILLTACTPNATLAPLPTVNSFPVVTETTIIDMHPAGFNRAPTDPLNSSSALFVAPTIADAQRVFVSEAHVPEQIKPDVAIFKASVDKVLDEVEKDCVIDAGSARVVYHEGSVPGVDNLYSWSYTIEGTHEGEPVVCWATKISTGQMGEYPIYYEQGTKRVKSLADGIMWQRTPKGTTADLAGTTPVLISRTHWINPEGLTGSDIDNLANWMALEAAPVVESSPVANPFSPENMNILANGGYYWNADGSLRNIDGNIVFNYQDGKLLDPRTGVATELASFSLHEIKAKDFQGREISAILRREVNGETQIYNPIADKWVAPLDLEENRAILEKNNFPRTRATFKDLAEINYNEIPLIAWEDYENGTLFYSNLNSLLPWPDDMNIQQLWIGRSSTPSNTWTVRGYPSESLDFGGFKPVPEFAPATVAENDPIRGPVSAVRVVHPGTGKEVILKAQQYNFDGYSWIIEMILGDELANPNSPVQTYEVAQRSLVNPGYYITDPIINWGSQYGTFCGVAGVAYFFSQETACAIQDSLPLPPVRTLLSPEIQAAMATFDGIRGPDGIATEKFPVTEEVMSALQAYLFPTFFSDHSRAYILTEAELAEELLHRTP